MNLRAARWSQWGAAYVCTFADDPRFVLSATLTLPDQGASEPLLTFRLTPKVSAWFSVAYTGAPIVAAADASEFWQPFIWHERRFPAQSYLTPGFQCPVPATFVRKGNDLVAVVVDSREFPFNPLPLLENSRFGVALRNRDGAAQPVLWPHSGRLGLEQGSGEAIEFRLRLYAIGSDATTAFEDIARRLYGLQATIGRNAISTLNQTIDRMIDYGLSHYSWFVDELKGCAYSTNVPGAVKNVSALNPLMLALVTDNEAVFQQRAYPIVEFLLSREKFLFSLNPKQTIQSPSRAKRGRRRR